MNALDENEFSLRWGITHGKHSYGAKVPPSRRPTFAFFKYPDWSPKTEKYRILMEYGTFFHFFGHFIFAFLTLF